MSDKPVPRCGGKPGYPMPVRLVLWPVQYIERCPGCEDCAPQHDEKRQ